MIDKLFFISLILIFLILYCYVKVESFENTTIPQTTQPVQILPTQPQLPISLQLTTEIARLLNISPRRISNIIFDGDITSGKLLVSFFIQEPNFTESLKREKNAADAGLIANNLLINDNFIVSIGGQVVKLAKLTNPTPTATETSDFFNNKGLLDVAKYSNNKYISVPNDESLTNFYKLDVDDNFNLIPKI